MTLTDGAPLTDPEFEGLMAPLLLNSAFAVAVSGGADSLALALLAHNYARQHGLTMIALTVDHGLRHNSTEEASWVHDTLTKRGINHEILTWKHICPLTTKIQERARAARYDLLGKWCLGNKIESLLTAHHQDDQIETFFMRLAHRSGLKGLSSMRTRRIMPFGILLRPLLKVPKKRLIATLNACACTWREDPSNENDKFERVRLRKHLADLYAHQILTPGALAASIQKLQSIDDFLDESVAAFFNVHTVTHFPLDAFKAQHSVLQRRLLGYVLKQLAQADYAPSDDLIDRACLTLMHANFKGVTLGGLYFKRAAGSMVDVRVEDRKYANTTV
ncbi:MAG: tRNA lysidine(34) synthetase TilS [Pseudomonadota bacterium]